MPIEPCLMPGHPLWEVFHESSKWRPSDWAEVSRRAAAHSRAGGPAPARPRRGPKLPLPSPAPGAHLDVGLNAVLHRRSSAREFAGLPLDMQETATLLWASAGLIANDANRAHARRTVPSAGACYPIDVYFWLPIPPAGVHPGPYHYDPLGYGASLVTPDPPRPSMSDLATASAFPTLVEQAGLLIVLSGVFARTTDRYGARGYRFVLLEAGHAAQNIYLAAAAMGLGAVALGGLDDALLDALLGLDGTRASVLYALAVGRAVQDRPPQQGDRADASALAIKVGGRADA